MRAKGNLAAYRRLQEESDNACIEKGKNAQSVRSDLTGQYRKANIGAKKLVRNGRIANSGPSNKTRQEKVRQQQRKEANTPSEDVSDTPAKASEERLKEEAKSTTRNRPSLSDRAKLAATRKSQEERLKKEVKSDRLSLKERAKLAAAAKAREERLSNR